MSDVKFNKLKESRAIEAWQEVKVTQMKHIVEVLAMDVEPTALLNFQKLDKYRYLNLEDGEILEYKLNENRSQNIAGLKQTFKKIRNLINNNFTGAKNELFVTLTYAENMTDTKQLMRDFDVFMKRFKRRYPNIDYLSVVEPQGRGAWHCHVLIRFNDLDSVFLDNNEVIAPMWGHGFVRTKSLKDVDNIGAYLNAYLTDVEVDDSSFKTVLDAQNANQAEWIELDNGRSVNINKDRYVDLSFVEKDVVDENGDKVKKMFLKGGRLHMYPSGMNLYRSSRGIKKPETEKMRYLDAKKIVGSQPANYSRTIDLSKDDQRLNSITYEQYNLKRKKCKGQEIVKNN